MYFAKNDESMENHTSPIPNTITLVLADLNNRCD